MFAAKSIGIRVLSINDKRREKEISRSYGKKERKVVAL